MTTLEKTFLILVLGFCAMLFHKSLSIEPPAQIFPLYVAGTTAVLTLLAFARSILRPMRGRVFDHGRAAVVLTVAVGLVGMAFLLQFSYIAAAVLFLFAGYLFLMPQRDLKGGIMAAVVTACTTGFTWVCFSVWLGVNLP